MAVPLGISTTPTFTYTLSIHKLSSERSVSFIMIYTKRNFFFSKKYTVRMLCNHRLFNMIKVFEKNKYLEFGSKKSWRCITDSFI